MNVQLSGIINYHKWSCQFSLKLIDNYQINWTKYILILIQKVGKRGYKKKRFRNPALNKELFFFITFTNQVLSTFYWYSFMSGFLKTFCKYWTLEELEKKFLNLRIVHRKIQSSQKIMWLINLLAKFNGNEIELFPTKRKYIYKYNPF